MDVYNILDDGQSNESNDNEADMMAMDIAMIEVCPGRTVPASKCIEVAFE